MFSDYIRSRYTLVADTALYSVRHFTVKSNNFLQLAADPYYNFVVADNKPPDLPPAGFAAPSAVAFVPALYLRH